MVALGLDLSLVATGYVIVDKKKILKQKIIRSKPTPDKKPISELKRILKIVEEIEFNGVDVVAIEGVAMMTRNSVSLVQLSALNYLVRKKAYECGVPFIIIPPSSLKKFISYRGNANKEEMIEAVEKYYGEKFLDNNLCDAYSLAVCVTDVYDNNLQDDTKKAIINNLSKQIYER